MFGDHVPDCSKVVAAKDNQEEQLQYPEDSSKVDLKVVLVLINLTQRSKNQLVLLHLVPVLLSKVLDMKIVPSSEDLEHELLGSVFGDKANSDGLEKVPQKLSIILKLNKLQGKCSHKEKQELVTKVVYCHVAEGRIAKVFSLESAIGLNEEL